MGNPAPLQFGYLSHCGILPIGTFLLPTSKKDEVINSIVYTVSKIKSYNVELNYEIVAQFKYPLQGVRKCKHYPLPISIFLKLF